MLYKTRPVLLGDILSIVDMMAKEGIPPNEVHVQNGLSFVMCEGDEMIGFFSFKNRSKGPELAHFCVSQEHRSFLNALSLAKAVKEKAKEMGLSMFYVSVKKPYLEKFIKWFFRPKSIYAHLGYIYFPVEVH